MFRGSVTKSLIILSFIIPAMACAENIAGVAASVNGYHIMEVKLQKAVESRLSQQGTNVGAIRDPAKYRQLRHDVLDVLIGQVLLWQAAEKANLLATNEEIDRLYNSYLDQYPNTDAFLLKMKQEGYNEESYRKELKQRLSAKNWVEQNVLKNLQVSDAEIHEFYTSNKQRFILSEQVHAHHILIKLDNDSNKNTKRNARKKLIKIKDELKAGGDFTVLAKKYSQGPSAAQGGDLGYFTRGKMVKPFEDAAFKLAPGEVSDIVETQFGYHLIKVTEKKQAATIKEEEVADQIRLYLLQTKSATALNEAIETIKQSAKIEKYIF